MLLNYDINALRIRAFITVMQTCIIITEMPEKLYLKFKNTNIIIY